MIQVHQITGANGNVSPALTPMQLYAVANCNADRFHQAVLPQELPPTYRRLQRPHSGFHTLIPKRKFCTAPIPHGANLPQLASWLDAIQTCERETLPVVR